MVRLIGLLSAPIGISGAAFAADLPPSPPRVPAVYVPAVLPVYNWAGIYVGINGGWGWGNVKYTANAVGGFPGTTGSLSDNGGVVGGTLGVNWQASAFVFGVEATGTIPASIPARLPASVPSVAIAKPAIIGWRRRGGAQVMRQIASCFI